MTRAQRIFYQLSRLGLGAAFLYAGILKAADLHAFAGAVAGYRLLPYSVNYLVAAALPWVEMLAGGLLLANRHVRAAALVLGALTGLFVAVLASAVVRGLDVECGCFGAATATSPWGALIRDGVLLVAAHLVFHLRPLPVGEEPS